MSSAAKTPKAPKPPKVKSVPQHIAVVMDGNGRWAKQRGLARTAGHEAGELALLDVVHGAIAIGVKELSAYAFSTENWRRSPEEVKFLLGFNRDVLRRRRDEMNELGVRIRWVGKPGRLWKSVINELEEAQELTKRNSVLTLNMCVNYGGRAELTDAMSAIARDVKAKVIEPDSITEKLIAKYLYSPKMSDVDMFLRTSGEQRTSNFLPWQSVYAEMVFMDVLWPDVDRYTLWQAIEIYNERERRFGKA
jgi:undecaprenyl diphosphate synthase